MKEDDLITRIGVHGASALEPIYVQYRSEFVGWLKKKYAVDVFDAREIYQQVILTLYENVVGGRLTHFSSTVKTYLFAIGKNKVMEWQRSNNKQMHVNNNFELMEEQDDLSDASNAQLEAIENALNQIGDPCKELLKRYYYDQWSMDKITNELDYKNRDTAKTQKYKCMQRLKKICNSISVVENE